MEGAEEELNRRSQFLNSLIQKKKKATEQHEDHDRLNVRVRASDMPSALQNRAFRFARDNLDSMPGKLDSKRLALALKKEFDSAYGPAWHCIVGTSFGSYVTHSLGGFLYFSIDKILWNPYSGGRDHHPFPHITYYCGCLQYMDVIEPYHPDRVLRQFGRVQRIPVHPQTASQSDGGATSASYRVLYPYVDYQFINWHNHLLRDLGAEVVPTRQDCVSGYIDWLQHISHLTIQNPEYRATIYQPDELPTEDPLSQKRIPRLYAIVGPINRSAHEHLLAHPEIVVHDLDQFMRVLDGHILEADKPTFIYTRRR